MTEAPTPWIKPILCDRCHKETKEVELVTLEPRFDRAKLCTKCTHELVKKIESHRQAHDTIGKRMEVELFQKFMGKYTYGYSNNSILAIIILLFIFIAGLIFVVSQVSKL